MGVKIVYVGKKPTATDNVARSGKTWMGNGDVQEVTLPQANILLKYPDQWAMAPDQEKPDGDGGDDSNPGGDGNTVDHNPGGDDDMNKITIVEKMTKDELVKFAKETFDVDLPDSFTKKQLLDEVERLKEEHG